MADNSKKVSELPTTTNAASTDRLLILRSPASNASVRTISTRDLANSMVAVSPMTIPNTVAVSNTVTITSNGTTPVSFISFDADGAFVMFHAADTTTGDITSGELYCAANTTSATNYVTVAEVGANKIRFDSAPSVNSTTGVVTLYIRRDSAATSAVTIRYSASYF